MTWCAVSTGRRVLRTPPANRYSTLLPRGTLVVEAPFPEADAQPGVQTLVDVSRDILWPNRLRLRVDRRGILLFEHLQGDTSTHAAVRFPVPEVGSALRYSLSWNAPQRIGLITVEDLGTGTATQRVFDAPRPWCYGDAAALAGGAGYVDANVIALAVSDRVEPTGLFGGFAQGTLIDTPDGPRPIETLKQGDHVQTSEHGVQPIRGIASYFAPSVGHFAPVHLTAPFFGLERDLTVAADHRLLVSGADAEYLFGAEEVLIEAHYLRRIAAPLPKVRPALARYLHVLLDAHVCISVGGGWAESLFVGDLAGQPARHATSILADTPARLLPRHGRIASPQLRGYEANVLVSALCA